MSIAEKLMEGPRLFDTVCERMKAGIRARAPDAEEDEVQQLLLQQIRRLRKVEEHAVYTLLECIDSQNLTDVSSPQNRNRRMAGRCGFRGG